MRTYVTIDLDDEVWESIKAAARADDVLARGVEQLSPRTGDQPRTPPAGRPGFQVGRPARTRSFAGGPDLPPVAVAAAHHAAGVLLLNLL